MEELTRLEERIMQCIWNYQGEVPFLDLIEMVKEKLNKDYKRTSIRGYLFRLEEKGYIKVTKKGRNAYVQPLINEESYGKYQAEKVLDRWFDGSAKRLVSALGEKLTKEDGEELRGILDDFDFDDNHKKNIKRNILMYTAWNDLISFLEGCRTFDRTQGIY